MEKQTLQFLGRDIVSKGTRKDGSEWKLFKLKFESGGKYPWTCSCFTFTKEDAFQPTQLIEGEWYEIVYTLEQRDTQHGPKTSKKVVTLKPASQDQSTQSSLLDKKEVTQSANPNSVTEFSLQQWELFAKEYLSKMQGQGSAEHMLAMYVATYHRPQFQQIITLCKKSFE